MLDSLKKIEEELTQPKAVTDYDLFNYPNKLNDKLAGLHDIVAAADARPTNSCFMVYDDLSEKIDRQLKKMDDILNARLPELNSIIEKEKLFNIRDPRKK